MAGSAETSGLRYRQVAADFRFKAKDSCSSNFSKKSKADDGATGLAIHFSVWVLVKIPSRKAEKMSYIKGPIIKTQASGKPCLRKPR